MDSRGYAVAKPQKKMTVRWPLLGARYRTEAFTVTRPTWEFEITVPVGTVTVVGAVVTVVDPITVFEEFTAVRSRNTWRRVDRRCKATVDGVGVNPCGDRRLTRDVSNTADVLAPTVGITVLHIWTLTASVTGVHEVLVACVADDGEQSIRAVRPPYVGHDSHRFREGADISLV
jgi:hypothetical protein